MAAGAGFLWYAHRYATDEAERAVRFHASFVANTILRDRLRPADFEGRVEGARRATLDSLFRREVLAGAALRVKLYARDGHVTYSNPHSLIGTRPTEEDAANALAGDSVTDETNLNHEGGTGLDARCSRRMSLSASGPASRSASSSCTSERASSGR